MSSLIKFDPFAEVLQNCFEVRFMAQDIFCVFSCRLELSKLSFTTGDINPPGLCFEPTILGKIQCGADLHSVSLCLVLYS